VPDPLTESTFQSAVLDWESRSQPAERRRLALVQALLATRRQQIMPRLAGATSGEAHASTTGLLTASWRMGDGTTLALVANLSNGDVSHQPGEITGTPIWGGALSESVPPWSVFWRIG